MTAIRAEWEQLWLPLRPLATDDLLAGLYRQSRPDALQRRYIEANPQAMSNLLIVDIDHPDSALRALSTRPVPHVIVENGANGHAHAVWGLREPVTRTEYARRKPLAFAASVTEGLRRAVDGDAGYSGLITKNPTHDDWHTTVVADLATLYSLEELRDGLGDAMPPDRWRRATGYRANVAGLGRNCQLFESARTWAYREARRIRQRHEHATPDDVADLLVVVQRIATDMNAAFPEPLPASEVRAIAASIHRWITRRSDLWGDARTVSSAAFVAIQSARGRRPRPARSARARIEEALSGD